MSLDSLINPLSLAIGFIITFLVESSIVYLFFRKVVPVKRIMLIVLLANLFTWPLVNAFGAIFLFSLAIIVILEILVAIAEAIIFYFLLGRKAWRSVLCSALGNAFSAIFGNVLASSGFTIMVVYLIKQG